MFFRRRLALSITSASITSASITSASITSATITTATTNPGESPRLSEESLLDQVRNKQVKIAVLGMGHVGLPTALGLAASGWHVLGVDSSVNLVSQLQSGIAPYYEP